MATISAALIVRNESALLERCLKSIAGVDQVVIVDTGSTDDTRIIASKYTTDLYDFTECNDKETGLINDFSLARNESLKHCISDWILWIDADEYFEEGGIQKFKKLIKEPFIEKYDAIYHMKDTGHEEHAMPWIFRNHKNIQFFDPIHETPGYPGRKPILNSYKSGVKKFADTSPAHELDPDRNFRILYSALKKEPMNIRYMYYIGREFLSRGNAYGAYYWYKRYARIAPNSNEKNDVCFTLATIELDSGDVEEAAAQVMTALICLPSDKESWKMLAALTRQEYKNTFIQAEKFADNKNKLFTRKNLK